MTPYTIPVLYSFRRCPYAMRARLAISSANIQVELREILLRNKAFEFLELSSKGTVPVLLKTDGTVIEESIDIMRWALGCSDPEGLMSSCNNIRAEMDALIDKMDYGFKEHLDRYKYAPKGDASREVERDVAMGCLLDLEAQLKNSKYLFGDDISFADIAILPFIRQFAFVDKSWFDQQNIPKIQYWLDAFINSERFLGIMRKYPVWVTGDKATYLGDT